MSNIQYKRIAAGLYRDAKIESFGIQPPHPTTFFTWLLAGPVFGVVPGCASIGRFGLAEQSGWTPDEIDGMMQPLIEKRIIQFDSKAPFMWLPNAIKYSGPRSPDNVVAWQSDWRKLPNCFLKERAWNALRAHCDYRDREKVFDKKTPRKTKNSFVMAFKLIDKPPESDITAIPDSDHRSDHRPTEKVDLNRNRNRNRNTRPDSGPSETAGNIASIDPATKVVK